MFLLLYILESVLPSRELYCRTTQWFGRYIVLTRLFRKVRNKVVGRDSSNSIAICYRLEDPRIESQWERGFPHASRPAVGPTQPIQREPCLFSGGKAGWGVALNTHTHLVSRLKKE